MGNGVARMPSGADLLPEELRGLAEDARVTVRRGGTPARDGQVRCVLDAAGAARDRQPCGGYGGAGGECAGAAGGGVLRGERGLRKVRTLRHFAFLQRGLADVEEDLAARSIGFVLRNAPGETVETLLGDVRAAMVVGDENPMRGPERWRRELARRREDSVLDGGCGCGGAVEADGAGAVRCVHDPAAAVPAAAGVSGAV